MKEECLICKAPLEYLNKSKLMECSICHKKEESKTRCTNGHYVCSKCHTEGVDQIMAVCLSETSKDPFVIFEKLINMPFCHMHGPEHHIIVGACLLTAYNNAGGEMKLNLEESLKEMHNRGSEVPGGICGFWGNCGAAVSTGIFISIVTGSTPLAEEAWGMSNLMTSAGLAKIGAVGGPRCCKRNSKLAMEAAVDFVSEHLGIQMEKSESVCSKFASNNQCIGSRCPFCKQI